MSTAKSELPPTPPPAPKPMTPKPMKRVTFAEFLEEEDIDAETAARALGKTRAYIHMLIAKSHTPSLHLAAVIEHWTGGRVPMQKWPDWKDVKRTVRPVVKS